MHTVMVILEAKVGSEQRLKEALNKVATLSRLEDSCIEYSLYQDGEHPTRFALFEKWKSKELHQEQFSKDYIKEFVKEAEDLLAGPFHGVAGIEVSQKVPL